MQSKTDGRQIAKDNEVRVLRAIHRFGWLRTRDLAALCWRRWPSKPNGQPMLQATVPTASALRMAQRTVRRLRMSEMILSGRGPDGSVIYSLSARGARKLMNAGIAASSGKDLVRGFSSAHYRHRCIANELAIAGIVQGFRVSTEREIAQGLWLGGITGIAGKRPDVLMRGDGRVYFIEVERSRKNAKGYAALQSWLGKVMQDHARVDGPRLLGPGQVWGGVIFICSKAFELKLLRDLKNSGWSQQKMDSVLSFDSVLYRLEDIAFS